MHGSTVFLIALLTSAITAFCTVYVVERYEIVPGRSQAVGEIVVPDLRGVTENDARANAAVAHLSLLIGGREPTAEGKPGTVIRQSIPAGQRVPRDQPVSIVVAEELPKVPSITNLPLVEATQRLEKSGYTLQVGGNVPDPTVAVGSIVSQMPRAEAALAKGGAVIVQVSAGPGEIEVPKLVGVPFAQAKADLEKLGAKVVVRWTSLGETPSDVVLGQRPAPGTKIKQGGEVRLSVNR